MISMSILFLFCYFNLFIIGCLILGYLFCWNLVYCLMCLEIAEPLWEKRFGEEVDEDLIYVVSVERVLQIEDFKEDGAWVTPSDYRNALPDPLRDFAEKLVNELNTNNVEDVNRFCNIYVDLNFQNTESEIGASFLGRTTIR